jgi:TetR/AcrR family transcriptional regulator, regulator of cefoperazone and chloramphenicol sensitivity
VPRSSVKTREQLLFEAERLFALKGIWQVQVQEIVVAADQRNTSAVTYHFGSREGLLEGILTSHGQPIDEHRGELLLSLNGESSTRALIKALVVPMVSCLETRSGCRYLQIISQFSDQFSNWRNLSGNLSSPHLSKALDLLESRPVFLPIPFRQERLIAMMQLMTSSLSERARSLEANVQMLLSNLEYKENLIDMLVGILEAPAGN